ncbi:MAG: iron-sulfur cluster insertion protein ErpA [Gammaproteobacteria bacterium]|nr:iron-sulfur cluster insertion protein ErpA [Gammaproteobacteria bacterium]MDH3412286.1 iron-sulfur cluster insertion protein ErpA [Gammaproteobacteria bacterium]
MSDLIGEMTGAIQLTSSAAHKVQELISKQGREAALLRVYIQGGGCSGFQYGFTFEDSTQEDDTVFEKEGVSLVVDPLSFQYLMGSEVDYREDLQGARFVINNPNAATTCGCGSSFSV